VGAPPALQTIEDVARQTVGEIDRIVSTLRAGDPPNGQVETPPGLAALGTLVAHRAAAGLTVTVTRKGEPQPLASAVDQAAYRILQEALTNAARHGTGEAQVQLYFGRSALELTVRNPTLASDTGSPGRGHGLIGMRERASLLGGTITAESRDGAFRVQAELPYGDRGP
jgi:signal transduction histidine kinase